MLPLVQKQPTISKMSRKMEIVGRFFQPPQGSSFLFGPRGTGKSLWTQQAYPEALRIDLLDPEIFRSYSSYPERLRQPHRYQRK